MKASLSPNELQPLRASSDNAAPNNAKGWRSNNSEDRRAFGQKRDVDRIFVAAGNKLLGAVERINEIITIGFGEQSRVFQRIFGNYRKNRAAKTGQTAGDDRFRRLVSAEVTGEPSASCEPSSERPLIAIAAAMLIAVSTLSASG